jgi:hypothetical protein
MGSGGNYVQTMPFPGQAGGGGAFCNDILIGPSPSGPAGYTGAPDTPSSPTIQFRITGAPIAANAMYVAPLTDGEAGNGIPLALPILGNFESPNAGVSGGGATVGIGPWMMFPPLAPGLFENDAGLVGGAQQPENLFLLLLFMTQAVVAAPGSATHEGLCWSIVSVPLLILE